MKHLSLTILIMSALISGGISLFNIYGRHGSPANDTSTLQANLPDTQINGSAASAQSPSVSAKDIPGIEKAAEQGDPESQCALGLMYSEGKGVPQDYVQAVVWFQKAADQGLPGAECLLAGAYLVGEGVAKDNKQALKWFHKAALQGSTEAQKFLKQMNVIADTPEAATLRDKAESGDIDAAKQLGFLYAYGEKVPQNPGEASHWLQFAADHGDLCAKGGLTFFGLNGEASQASGFQLFLQAAENGDAFAQSIVASCYSNGSGLNRIMLKLWLGIRRLLIKGI